jgi:hypothetical protein
MIGALPIYYERRNKHFCSPLLEARVEPRWASCKQAILPAGLSVTSHVTETLIKIISK